MSDQWFGIYKFERLKITKLEAKESASALKFTLNIQGLVYCIDSPKVMGIINTTPDSFYEGSRSTQQYDILSKAESMLHAGVDLLDVGGYSTRPGATEVTAKEELSRVLPAIQSLRREFPKAILSVDTFRAQVAEAAVAEGADIINDISGGALDDAMFATVAKCQKPYILMHSRGNPQNMRTLTDYSDIFSDLMDYFILKIDQLRKLGVKDIIIDPGIGFAKTMTQNFDLLRHLHLFKELSLPLLVGVSRKSMIYKALETDAASALNGTTALHMAALLQGADILRVHDVKEAVETVTLYNLLKG